MSYDHKCVNTEKTCFSENRLNNQYFMHGACTFAVVSILISQFWYNIGTQFLCKNESSKV